MKNIYDIITEQKAIVDVNIASYDLEYTVNHMIDNDCYLQEGLGDNVRNIAQKVIEFIKTIINKIKELVNKAIGYFKNMKRGKLIDLDKINFSVGNPPNINVKPGDNTQKNQQKEITITEQELVSAIKASQKKVNVIRYVNLNIKKDLADRFLSSVYSTSSRFTEDKDGVVNHIYLKSILKQGFRGEGSIKKHGLDEKISIVDRIKLELNEPTEPQEYTIANLANELFSYNETDEIISIINNLNKTAIDGLNKLKQKIESKEIQDNASLNEVQKVTSMTASFVGYLIPNISKAFNSYKKIVNVAVNDYVTKKYGK